MHEPNRCLSSHSDAPTNITSYSMHMCVHAQFIITNSYVHIIINITIPLRKLIKSSFNINYCIYRMYMLYEYVNINVHLGSCCSTIGDIAHTHTVMMHKTLGHQISTTPPFVVITTTIFVCASI